MEFTLLWAALTGVAALYFGAKVLAEGRAAELFDHLLVAGMIGLAGGRVVQMVSSGLNPITNLADFLIVRGGVNTPAAAGFAIASLYVATGRHIDSVDAAAPAALFGLAGWHLGCVWRGACLGTAADLPWTWSEPGSSVNRHPVELYAALGLLAAGWLISRVGRGTGTKAGLALMSAAAIRLITEPMRLSITGGPVFWYGFGVLVGFVGVVVSVSMRRNPAAVLE